MPQVSEIATRIDTCADTRNAKGSERERKGAKFANPANLRKNKGHRKLKRNARQKIEIRGLVPEDFRFLFAAYKTGELTSFGGEFENGDLEPAEFRDELEIEILENYHGAWMLLAETRRGFLPVGMVLGYYSHRDPAKAPFMILADMIWMPWASPRRRVEAAIRFLDMVRKEIPMMGYADLETKAFFEIMGRHGIMRRVGTTHNVLKDEPVAIFETKRPSHG